MKRQVKEHCKYIIIVLVFTEYLLCDRHLKCISFNPHTNPMNLKCSLFSDGHVAQTGKVTCPRSHSLCFNAT